MVAVPRNKPNQWSRKSSRKKTRSSRNRIQGPWKYSTARWMEGMMEDDSPGMKRHSYNSALKLLQKHFPIFVYKDGKDHGYDVDLVMKHFINELRKVRVGGRAEKVLVEGWLNEWGRNHGWMIEVPESVSKAMKDDRSTSKEGKITNLQWHDQVEKAVLSGISDMNGRVTIVDAPGMNHGVTSVGHEREWRNRCRKAKGNLNRK